MSRTWNTTCGVSGVSTCGVRWLTPVLYQVSPMDAETRSALVTAVAELDAEHRPDLRIPLLPRGGCVMCWPKDGSWPCVTRLIADELRAIVEREDGDG